MGTLYTNYANLWTDHLQAQWFRDKHKDFIEKLRFYDECVRPSITTVNGERLYQILIDIINRGANKAFVDDIAHLCNKFTGWGQYERRTKDPQAYSRNLSVALRVAIMEFMPAIKEYVDSNKTIRQAVTQ